MTYWSSPAADVELDSLRDRLATAHSQACRCAVNAEHDAVAHPDNTALADRAHACRVEAADWQTELDTLDVEIAALVPEQREGT